MVLNLPINHFVCFFGLIYTDHSFTCWFVSHLFTKNCTILQNPRATKSTYIKSKIGKKNMFYCSPPQGAKQRRVREKLRGRRTVSLPTIDFF